MVDTVDALVVGAGVIGLAVARALSRAGREVVIVEAENSFGTQTSSRNSEVIHAGIYYPTGSRKATLCVAGRAAMYRYCADHDVPVRRIGKLIVATDPAQLADLDRIRAHAADNGVDDLRPVSPAELNRLEPELAAVGALLSPSTGIVDAHTLMRSYLRDIESDGGTVVFGTRVTDGRVGDGIEVTLGTDVVRTRALVNCAGVSAWSVAAALDGFPADRIPSRHLAKGNYFTLATGRSPFSRLIYPVPVDGGLGVHLTLDMSGAARFGPDVEWLAADIDDPDLRVDPARAAAFYSAIRHYWPGLPDDALAPDYAGIRPKLSGPGESAADFAIQGPREHGIGGLVNLFGIESPGLTSSLAVADAVTTLL